MEDIRTAKLAKELEEAKRKIWEQEIIIAKHEKDKQSLAEAINNIMGESFK